MHHLFRSSVLCLLIGIFLAGMSCSSQVSVKDPNLLIVIIDTLRADRLGCYGYKEIRTPHIDRLAEEGMLFDNAVCQVPLTFPSHSSIFTGRYPTAHGVRHNGLFKLGEEEVTLAEILKENGFKTAAFVGSYVLNSYFGLKQGFTTYSDTKVTSKAIVDATALKEIQGPERAAEEVNEDFFRWLSGLGGERFFAWVHYYDPHWPYRPPEWSEKEVEGVGYDREVSYSDQCFGDVMVKLKEEDLLEDTVVVFLSDHGEALGEHGEFAHGIFIYDCCMKVPMIIRAPWLIEGGTEYRGLFETVDIMPTLLELLGIPVPASVQGESFARRMLKGDVEEGKEESYGETYMPTLEYGWSELKSIRKSGMKYIEAPIPELYDLEEDPGELENLHSEGSEESRMMREDLAVLMERITPEGIDPYEMEEIDEEKVQMLKSLGYLSGDYFRGGKIEPGQRRVDPKLTIEEENILLGGKRMMGEGRLQEAGEIFEKVLSKNPKNYQARIFLIKVMLAMGNFERAEEESSKAIQIAELDQTAMLAMGDELWNMYGHLLERRKDLKGAEKAYRQGYELNPNKDIAFNFLANFFISHEKYDQAIGIVEEALESNPDNVLANSYLFQLTLHKNDFDGALEIARKLLTMDLSHDIETLVLVANLLKAKDLTWEAARAFEQMANLQPQNVEVLSTLGDLYLRSNEYEKATEVFEKQLQINFEDYRPHFYLGIIALKANEEEKARERFDQVLSINPTFYPVFDALGSWLKEQGRMDEAKEEFRKALSLNPEDQIALQALRSME